MIGWGCVCVTPEIDDKTCWSRRTFVVPSGISPNDPPFRPPKSSCRVTIRQQHLLDHENQVTRRLKTKIRYVQNEHRVIRLSSQPPTPAAGFRPGPSTHPGCPYHLHSSHVPESTHHLTPPSGRIPLHVKHAAIGSFACRHISAKFPASRLSSLSPSGNRAQLWHTSSNTGAKLRPPTLLPLLGKSPTPDVCLLLRNVLPAKPVLVPVVQLLPSLAGCGLRKQWFVKKQRVHAARQPVRCLNARLWRGAGALRRHPW
jgi:hypothetical protein